jgi:peptide/nickel transport system permease protein
MILLGPEATPEQIADVRAHLGLDKSVAVQFVLFMTHAAEGDLGESIVRQRPVTELIAQTSGASLELAGTALIIIVIWGLPMGVMCAVNRGRVLDVAGRAFSFLGQSLPAFFVGLVLMLVFAVWLGILPTSGRLGPSSLVLPAFSLSFSFIAAVTRLTRSSMLDCLDTEYVKLARIKGLSEGVVIWKHALKNALIPVVTYGGMMLPHILCGAIVIETVFSWPGLGRLLMEAVLQRDFPLIQGLVIFFGAVLITLNLIVDVVYVYLNPKVRYTKT